MVGSRCRTVSGDGTLERLWRAAEATKALDREVTKLQDIGLSGEGFDRQSQALREAEKACRLALEALLETANSGVRDDGPAISMVASIRYLNERRASGAL